MIIAELIEKTLVEQGRSKAWLSDQMNLNYKTLTGKFKRNSFDALELVVMGKLLGIDLNKIKEEV